MKRFSLGTNQGLKKLSASIFLFGLFFTFSLTLLPLIASADCVPGNCLYIFLAPIKQLSGESLNIGGANGANAYLKQLYTFGVSIASGLAVIMIVLGGTQYASTDAIGGKSEGKKRIESAVTGLILALLSYTILNTINPNLVSVNFAPPPITVNTTAPAVTPVTAGGGNGTNPNGQAPGTIDPNASTDAEDLTNSNIDFGNRLPGGGSITRYGGGTDSTTTPDEDGSVFMGKLSELKPDTQLYVAYPLSGHTVPGLPDYPDTGAANRQLRNKVVRVLLNDGTSVDAFIADRGPGDGENFDVSGLLDLRIRQGGGVSALQLVDRNN